VHVRFGEAETVLAANGGIDFSGDSGAAYGELNDGWRKKGHMGACCQKVFQLAGGKDVSIIMKLSRQGKILICHSIVLVTFDMLDFRWERKVLEKIMDGCKSVKFGVEGYLHRG
jgi:hypothetical protein